MDLVQLREVGHSMGRSHGAARYSLGERMQLQVWQAWPESWNPVGCHEPPGHQMSVTGGVIGQYCVKRKYC